MTFLKKNNIYLSNYESLYEQYFKDKFSIDNLIKFKRLDDKFVLNLNYNITFSDMVADSNFLYLCINCDVIKYKILKINLEKGKVFLDITLTEEISTTGNMIKLLIDNKIEELIIFSIGKQNKLSNLYFYNKYNLTFKETKKIQLSFSESEIIQGLFTSISKFYISTSLNLYLLTLIFVKFHLYLLNNIVYLIKLT